MFHDNFDMLILLDKVEARLELFDCLLNILGKTVDEGGVHTLLAPVHHAGGHTRQLGQVVHPGAEIYEL